MAGKLCGALSLLEEGQMGIVVGDRNVWNELEESRKAVQAASSGPGSGRKLSRLETAVKRARSYMAAASRSGFELVGRQQWLVSEGKHPSGQLGIADIAVFAFKYDQYRCYGGYLQYGKRRCFVCVEADSAKKQNKPDMEMVRRVAKRVGEFAADAIATPLGADEKWPTR